MYFLSLCPVSVTLDEMFVQQTLLSPCSGPGTSRSEMLQRVGHLSCPRGACSLAGNPDKGGVGCGLIRLPREHTGPQTQGESRERLGQGKSRLRAGRVGQSASLVCWFVLVLWADVTLVTSLPPESIFEDVNFIEIQCTYEKRTHLQLDEFL